MEGIAPVFLLGLTGSIGTGKSTTARLFRAYGVPVHDADAAVHALYRGEAAPLIESAFPGSVVGGAVDRRKLGALLDGQPERFRALERIVHPLVHAAEARAIERARQDGKRLMVLDIPLLFETGGEKRCHGVLVTSVDAMEQRRRVLARDGMSDALFNTILARQMPDAEKCRRAHMVLDTGHGIEAARRDIAALLKALAPALN